MVVWSHSWKTNMTDRPAPGHAPARGSNKFPDLRVRKLVALFMMDIGRVNGVIRTKVRHPMLIGVVIWSVAHLLVNGELSALVLFGGLALWALLQMAVISRAEGPWEIPTKGSILSDGKVAVLAVVLYTVIAGIHYWLDHPAIVFL